MSPAVVIAFLLVVVLAIAYWYSKQSTTNVNLASLVPVPASTAPSYISPTPTPVSYVTPTGSSASAVSAPVPPMPSALKEGDYVQMTIANTKNPSPTCSDDPGSTMMLVKGVICKIYSNGTADVKWMSMSNLNPSPRCKARADYNGPPVWVGSQFGADWNSVWLGGCGQNSSWDLQSNNALAALKLQ